MKQNSADTFANERMNRVLSNYITNNTENILLKVSLNAIKIMP